MSGRADARCVGTNAWSSRDGNPTQGLVTPGPFPVCSLVSRDAEDDAETSGKAGAVGYARSTCPLAGCGRPSDSR
eukprot:7385867-Prymnesium_polylepis.1